MHSQEILNGDLKCIQRNIFIWVRPQRRLKVFLCSIRQRERHHQAQRAQTSGFSRVFDAHTPFCLQLVETNWPMLSRVRGTKAEIPGRSWRKIRPNTETVPGIRANDQEVTLVDVVIRGREALSEGQAGA